MRRPAFALLALLVLTSSAFPQGRRVLVATEGVPLQLSYYMWFSFQTCKSLGLPEVSNMRSSSGARIWAQKEERPLGTSNSKEGERCIGKSMSAAVVYYTARPGFSGEDTVEYFVRYPETCKNCQSRDYSVVVKVLPKTTPDTIDTETTTQSAR